MTAVEIMAKAHYDHAMDEPLWHEMSETERKAFMADMRAALLALAEIELPETALNAAGAVNDHLARQEFAAIIKALAEEGK